mgnify:CR=1 FL=1|tara:strand:+ start:921 stop:1268 length:348 start_codon:yes stop_codon:yes gene_type:complete
MKSKIILIKTFLLLILLSVISTAAFAANSEGKEIAFERTKGNCLACHAIDDGALPGNIGPPLIGMKARFPDRAVLKAQIWDATVKNKTSMMPPIGKHQILSDQEVEKVIDYLYTL